MLNVFMHIDDMYLVPLMVVVKVTPIEDGYFISRKERIKSKLLSLVIVRKRDDEWQNVLNGQVYKSYHSCEGDLVLWMEHMMPIRNDFPDAIHVTNDELEKYLNLQNAKLFKGLDVRNNFFKNLVNCLAKENDKEVVLNLEDSIGKENVDKLFNIMQDYDNNVNKEEKVKNKVRKKVRK